MGDNYHDSGIETTPVTSTLSLVQVSSDVPGCPIVSVRWVGTAPSIGDLNTRLISTSRARHLLEVFHWIQSFRLLISTLQMIPRLLPCTSVSVTASANDMTSETVSPISKHKRHLGLSDPSAKQSTTYDFKQTFKQRKPLDTYG